MRKELENLWYYYLSQFQMDKSDEEKRIIKNWSEKEDYFRSKLSKEQLEILEEYDNATMNIGRISEMDAFLKGVKFAARLMVEVLYEKN